MFNVFRAVMKNFKYGITENREEWWTLRKLRTQNNTRYEIPQYKSQPISSTLGYFNGGVN